jgi:ubiquinone/menaquinone biosynthesis C-methylase UbiE
MRFTFHTYFYRMVIDTLLAGLRAGVTGHISPSDHVLDIACGTGALALEIAVRAARVTGIDLNTDLIAAAQHTARRRGASNTYFEVHDASDLSRYPDSQFDIAVTSMAVHQFDADIAIKILSEMKRISGSVIIADYNCPMRRGLPGAVAWGIESVAGDQHFHNFKNYMQKGGIQWFAEQAGLAVQSVEIKGGGVFAVVKCDTPGSRDSRREV